MVLWDAWALTRDEQEVLLAPTDIELATLWNVWLWRQEMLLMQNTLLDSLIERVAMKSGGLVAPFLNPAVVGIGGRTKTGRRFRFGSLSGRERGQAWHLTEDAILSESYLAPFMDAPLPGLDNALSCKTLQVAWCVIRDCAKILASKCNGRGIGDVGDLECYALLVRRSEIERAISHCAGIPHNRARAAVDFLSCNLSDTGSLFTKGFWAKPLISIDANENTIIALPAISVGSAIRRVESWLDEGGLSDRLSTARRGLRYEAWVRQELINGLAANSLLSNARCARDGIGRNDEDEEQIDLLLRLGNILVVGEVKCLLAPIEAMEHFNYLTKLNEASKQAIRKAKWISDNRDIAARALGLSLKDVEPLRPIPIVVLNQSAGVGLLFQYARVVDLHFLRLYLTYHEYSAGHAFNVLDKMGASEVRVLYDSEQEAADRFEQIMANPPTIDRFKKFAKWERTRFPMSNGQSFQISVCNFDDEKDHVAKKLASVVSR
jgi:hypothetical protein